MESKYPRLSMKLNRHHIVSVLFAVIIVSGFALRFYSLSYRSLWLDEVSNIRFSEKHSIMELSQMFKRRLPPLYRIFLHLFLILGNNEFVVRLPSAIFGLLSILFIYKVGALFFGRREGLISAFLLSVSTIHIRYSQDATMYSLAMFLALSSVYFFYRALKEGAITMWIGFIVSTLLGIFTHYYLLFVPLIEMPLFVFILLKNRGSLITGIQKAGKKKIFVGVMSLIIIAALAFPFLLAAYTSILASFKTGIAFWVPWGIKPTPSFFITLFDNFNTGGFLPWAYKNCREPIFCTFLLILLFGLLASLREYKKPAALLFLWVFLPTTAVFILSLVLDKPIVTPRYMIFILPGYLVSVSRGISCIADSLAKRLRFLSIAPPERSQLISFAIVIVIFVSAGVIPLQQYYEWENENWRGAAEYLDTNASPGDIILVEYSIKCLLYYYDLDSEGTYMMSVPDSLIENIESFHADYDWIKIFNIIDANRLVEGQKYEISAWYRGDIPLAVYLTLHDANWKLLNMTLTSVYATSEWKEVTLSTEPIPSGVVHASLCFKGEAVGYFLIDDCTMFEQTHAGVNILSNSGFEDGLGYWEFEQGGGKIGYFDLSADSRTGQCSGQLTVTGWMEGSSIQSDLFLVYAPAHSSRFDTGRNKDWLHSNFIEVKRFKSIIIYYRPKDLILIFTKSMQFVGLDTAPDEPVAGFWHNNDSAAFEVDIPKNGTYTLVIHAKSSRKSAVEISIDGAAQGTKTFVADSWSCVELNTFYLESGSHEIKITSREGNDLGDTNIYFDFVALYPSS